MNDLSVPTRESDPKADDVRESRHNSDDEEPEYPRGEPIQDLTEDGDVEKNPGPAQANQAGKRMEPRKRTRSVRSRREVGATHNVVLSVDVDSVTTLLENIMTLAGSGGRGSLLTAGDVEKNPGPQMTRENKAPNLTVRAQNVNVSGNRRRRRRNRKPRKQVEQATILKPQTLPGESVAPSGGRGTMDPPVHEICAQSIDPSEGAVGWFYKYMDPAGAVESGKALGEFSKVPDGLLRYSVDAEQRPIVTIECPTVPESDLPLDGKLWRVSFISLPAFRVNFIALANINNEALTLETRNTFIQTLNNLTNWRDLGTGQWAQFAPGWYYSIHVLPNTYAMAETGERTDSVTQFRKVYKGITFEFNAPTLIDQGWWVGAHIPVKPQSETIPAAERFSAGSMTVSTSDAFLMPAATTARLIWSITPLPAAPVTITGSTGSVQNTSGQFFSAELTGNTSTVFAFTSPASIIADGEPFADEGDTVTLTMTTITATGVTYSVSSTLAGSAVIVRNTIKGAGVSITPVTIGIDTEAVNRLSIEMPALTTEEVTTNVPKYEQFLCKESGGAYIVHYKMNNPVFEMTGEENFGGFQFHYPGYNPDNNALGLRGIIDTFENNFSCAVVHFWGISQSATIICKTYDGWEGTTNAGSTVGQFAHTGAEEEDEVVQLANRLQMELTGVYQADDNFAGTVSALASIGLGLLGKSSATPSVIKGIAQQAIGAVQANPGVLEGTVKAIGSVGARLVGSIKARRARRRARRAK
uniref:Capsid protein n=1 Tax=Providence virus TaxID=213633 RepID=A0A142F307_9LUTE|nr:capsid protein precursor [Providence virus]